MRAKVEVNYTAFGLKIAGISSNKLGDPNEGLLDNKNLYNDKELFDDADLDWYDYGFRNYDPQIGRFTQLDPLTDGYPYYTPFQYAGNEPIANVDMDGLEQFQTLTPVVVKGLSKAAPAATNAGLSIFKISTKIIPTISKLAVVHSEASSVNRQLQTTIQSQLSAPSEQQEPTISSCCNYFVSEEQKSIYADRTSDAGYNADNSEKKWLRIAKNKTFKNFANNLALPIITAAVGEGTGKLFFEGGSLLFEASTNVESKILTGTVKSNFNRFINKIPANSKNNVIVGITEDGNYLFSATSPARNIPGSRAVYEKIVSPEGVTIKYTKTTYDAAGKIIHIKPK